MLDGGECGLTNYYVSNTGSDSNDGKSINTPWATLNKVNSSQGIIKSGDVISFKRNNTFYGNIMLPTINSAAVPITVTAYGEGKRPVISAYKIGNLASSWKLHVNNIWKIDLTDTTKFTGNIYTKDVNIGFMKVDGNIKPVKRFSIGELKNQWEFYSDNNKYLYVYSTTNPTSLAKDIKIAPNIGLLFFKDAIKISELDLCGTGGHGINGVVNNTTVTNCDIHEIGGSVLVGFGDGKTRYGNGIEVWAESKNVTIQYNNIYDCYDTGYTMQGPVTSVGFNNIIFRYNTEWNNSQSFEVSATGSTANTGFVNCKFENNTCINAGYGWSYDVRPDKEVAVHLLIYNLSTPLKNISVKNNLFYNARNALYYGDLVPGYDSNNNTIFLKQNQIIYFNHSYMVEQHAAFSADTGKERDSLFFAINNVNNINRV